MIQRAISILFILFIVATSVLLFCGSIIIWLLTALFDKKLTLLHFYTSVWGSLYVWMMPAWKVTKKGRENIQKKTYIVVSNHQSLLDILVAFGLFFPFKWVSKAEIFMVPFIGWNMYLNRYVLLKRGDLDSVKQMLNHAESHLKQGSSVYFFPEGSRSESGTVKPFKHGAFILAKKMKIPILPVVIKGTAAALPKHSLNFHGKQEITIQVLPEVDIATYANMSAGQLAQHTHSLISSQLPQTETVEQAL